MSSPRKGKFSMRKIDRVLKENGYILDRQRGDHFIYKNERFTISIPMSRNDLILKKEFKRCGIDALY